MFKKKLTKTFLEKLYQKYNKLNSAEDPIWFVISQQNENENDKEVLAFIASIYAFGNVVQINKVLEKIFSFLNLSPAEKIKDRAFIKYIVNKEKIEHRFLFHNEFTGLLLTLNRIYLKYGSLKNLFLKNYNPADENLKNSIVAFSSSLRKIHLDEIKVEERKLKFLYPSPSSGSACKRINLFLRWMVRKDNIDLGLWSEIKTSQLVIPLDTHIFQLARYFGLTKLKTPSWNMAVEITNELKKFSPEDPVKYDFALSHLKLEDKINY